MTAQLQTRNSQTLANLGDQYTTLPDARVVAMFLHGRTDNTLRKYAADLRLFVEWLGGQLFVERVEGDLLVEWLGGRSYRDVTLPELQQWVETLTGAPKTVRERVSTVRSFYSWSVKLGILRVDPAAMLKLPKQTDAIRERILSKDQYAAMIAAAKDGRDRTLLDFLYQSGCRVSELVLLKVKHLRFGSDGTCLVDLYRPKTNKTTTQRYSATTSTIPAQLRALVAGRAPEDYVFRSSGVPSTITGRAGANTDGPLDPSAVWRIARAAAKRAGIQQKVSSHWFRHGCATHLVEREPNLQKVAQWLGHESIQTTMRYSHIAGDLDLSHHFGT